MRFKFLTGYLVLTVAAVIACITLSGCSVNVIVAPEARISVSSDESQNPYQYLEAAPAYDCVAGPDADVCQ